MSVIGVNCHFLLTLHRRIKRAARAAGELQKKVARVF
jgi:hypothetical protein